MENPFSGLVFNISISICIVHRTSYTVHTNGLAHNAMQCNAALRAANSLSPIEPFVSRSFTTAAVECNFCHLLLCSNENECFPTGLATPLLSTVCKRVRCYKRIARIPCTHNSNSNNNNTASRVILSWTNGAEHTSTGEKSERKNIGNADRTQYHQNTKQ